MRSAATAAQWAQLTSYPCWLADYSGVGGQHSTINGQTGTSEGGVITGPEQFRDLIFIPFTTAFPDLRVEIVGTVAEGDEVVVRWMARGTHAGEAD